jgi:hypothetical protein
MGAAIRGPSGLIDLGAEPFTIGRSRNNRLVLSNSQVSSKHAEIQPLAGGRYQVVDVGSTNGTSVNGVRLSAHQPQPLNAGDTITLGGSGGVELRFELSADAPWQANQPQMAGAPGGFGVSDPAAPPAQPFGGGISQPPPGQAGFPPAPDAFGPPPGQPVPAYAAPQPAFPAPPGGPAFAPPAGPPAAGPAFPPPGAPAGFGAPPGAPPAVGFPPPGGPEAAPFGAPPAQGPNFPPPGGPQFGAPASAPPAGFPPPGGPGPAPFGGPGGPPPAGFPPPGGPQFGPPGGPQFAPPGGAPGYPPPGGPVPAKRRTGRLILLLAGSLLVVIILVVGIVFAVRLVQNKKPASPTPTPRGRTYVRMVPALSPSSDVLLKGEHARYSVVLHVEGAAVVSAVVVSKA